MSDTKNAPKLVIRINNPSNLAEVVKSAEAVVEYIEAGWDSKLKQAQDAYNKLGWFGRLYHSLALVVFRKGKLFALNVAKEEHSWIYFMQRDVCKDVIRRVMINKSVNLSEFECRMTQLTHLWEKYSKVSQKKS